MFSELVLLILQRAVNIVGWIVERQGAPGQTIAQLEFGSGEIPIEAAKITKRRKPTNGRGKPKRKAEKVLLKRFDLGGHRTKQCVKCGMTKGVSGFHVGSLECRSCERAKTEGGRR
jgi:hypothetical protein